MAISYPRYPLQTTRAFSIYKIAISPHAQSSYQNPKIRYIYLLRSTNLYPLQLHLKEWKKHLVNISVRENLWKNPHNRITGLN